MKPKIIIDGIPLLSKLTGIGRYTYEISKELILNDEFDVEFFYGYHSKKLLHPSKNSEIKNIKSLLTKNQFIKKVARKILMLSSKIISPKYNLYWSPNFIPINGIKASKIVTTVHDFSFYLHPQWHPIERLDYFNKYFLKNIKKTDWIITGSEFTKQEIIKYLKFPDEKITVIHHGIDKNLYKIYELNILTRTKIKFKLSDNFLLFVGSIEPRKNLLNLLKAYHILPDVIKKRYPLILVGFKGWNNDDIMKEIEKEKNNIRYLGYLSDEELAHIYNLASIFVYPSLYEGFGIPPLEAMACGTPIIASNVASMPEACANAAVYIDPYDYIDIANNIELLVKDENKMNSLIEKGLERVKEFTWEKSAKAHMKVFKKVLDI